MAAQLLPLKIKVGRTCNSSGYLKSGQLSLAVGGLGLLIQLITPTRDAQWYTSGCVFKNESS